MQKSGWIFTPNQHTLQIQRSLLQEAYNRNITIEIERAKYNVHVIFQWECYIGGNENVKKMLLELLSQPKATKNQEIIPFTITYNPKNPNVFPKVN